MLDILGIHSGSVVTISMAGAATGAAVTGAATAGTATAGVATAAVGAACVCAAGLSGWAEMWSCFSVVVVSTPGTAMLRMPVSQLTGAYTAPPRHHCHRFLL